MPGHRAEQGLPLHLRTLGLDRCSPGPHRRFLSFFQCPLATRLPGGPVELALLWPCCEPHLGEDPAGPSRGTASPSRGGVPLGVGAQVPVVSGRGLPPRATSASQFAEDFCGVSTASSASQEAPRPQGIEDGRAPARDLSLPTMSSPLLPSPSPPLHLHPWNSLLLFLSTALSSLPPRCPQGSPASPRPSLQLQSLLVLAPFCFRPPVCLCLSLPPVPKMATLLVSGVCLSSLCPLPRIPSPFLPSYPLCLPDPAPGSLAPHLPWVVQASLRSSGMHPQGWLGWEPGLGAVTGREGEPEQT